MRIGLLGAGRIGKMHGGPSLGLGAVGELLVAHPIAKQAEKPAAEPGPAAPEGLAWPNSSVYLGDASRDGLLGGFQVATGEATPTGTARDGVESAGITQSTTRSLSEHRVVRPEEIPA